jgi:hypothetical protein
MLHNSSCPHFEGTELDREQWGGSLTKRQKVLGGTVADPNTKSIFEGLKSLHVKGIISTELLEWATELRVLRNLGAHATSQKNEVFDALGALDFLQAILEILYDLRPRFEQFKKRRKTAS